MFALPAAAALFTSPLATVARPASGTPWRCASFAQSAAPPPAAAPASPVGSSSPAAADADAGSTDAAPAPGAAAVIRESASTNRTGYAITVPRAGRAMLQVGTVGRATSIDPQLVTRFYADLERAGDLAKLAVDHCMKSASFGSTTIISYNGEDSPDVQCAGDAAGRALNADAEAIARAALTGAPVSRRRTQPIFRASPSPSQR